MLCPTRLYLKWITDKNLLHSTGNSARCHTAAWMREEFGGEWIHVYVWLHPFAVHLKPSQHCLLLVLSLVAQSRLTPCCDPTDFSPLGFSVHGILQARILEGVAMPSSRGSSQPRNQAGVSCIAGGFLTSWDTREAHLLLGYTPIQN